MLTLFQLCLDFTARNVHYVDSLKGFPELIGQMLADKVACLRDGRFTATDVRIVEVFTKAYGTQVLQSLQISHSKLLPQQDCDVADRVVDTERLSLLNIIKSSALSQLCLSFNSACRSMHWISTIGQCSLTHLALRGVGLTDSDITYLTACASVRQRGISLVVQLDLAENYLTARCLAKLQCLDSLTLCNVSNNLIQASQVDAAVWSISLTDLSKVDIVNKGWLADHIAARAQCELSHRASTATFYKSNKKPADCRILVLTKCKTSQPKHSVHKRAGDSSGTFYSTKSKHSRRNENCITEYTEVKDTSAISSSSTTTDSEMMAMYS